jgi:glyoxylase I family protein
MLFTGVDHPAIACFDVQKMIDWYCAHLGMRLVATNGQNPPSVVVGYSQDTKGATMIELMPIRTVKTPNPNEVDRWSPGVRHIALRVTDFDAAYAKLKSAGVEFLGDPVQAVGGGKIVSFRDVEGNELQIVQR